MSTNMKIIVAVLGTFLGGILIGASWSSPDSEQSASDPAQDIASSSMSNHTPATGLTDTSLAKALQKLEARVDEEIRARKALETELRKLRKELLTQDTQNPHAEDIASIEDLATTPDVAQPFGANSNAQTRERDALHAVGIDMAGIERIERQVESLEMKQLYLRNQAVREGWYGTEKFFSENRKLERESDIYRDELGDDRYDRFLYESGEANRVAVQSVLASSPAEKAGVVEGDIVLRYDGKRIFNWTDLTTATATGEPEQTVRVEIIRDGQPLDVYMPRGPLGVRLESTRVDPRS